MGLHLQCSGHSDISTFLLLRANGCVTGVVGRRRQYTVCINTNPQWKCTSDRKKILSHYENMCFLWGGGVC